MWRNPGRTRFGRICCLALSLFLSALLLGCASVSAQEKMYEVTEAELTRLEQNLDELATVNGEQREKLTSLRERLKGSEARLKESERNSRMLEVKLDWLSKELTEQASSLENANRLLKEYEQEERRTRRRLERQRNMAYIIAALAVGVCVAT